MTNPLKIGHRGAKGHMAENTLESIQKALDLNVDMIEIDIQVCKTGELVVIHDEDLDRTTNGMGTVLSKTYQEIKSLKTIEGFKIPTLAEVLEVIEDKAILNIELKSKDTAAPMLEVLKKYPGTKTVISSFDFDELMTLRSLDSEIAIAVLTEDDLSIAFLQARHLNASSINAFYKLITRDFIRDCHRNGMSVNAFTVNKPENIKKLKKLEIDGIISDFPDRI